MPALTRNSDVLVSAVRPADDAMPLARLENRLPPLLSIIAGMVDLTGFFTLGNIFTAHITGNLVVAAAAAVRGGPLNPAQLLAIPVFMLALAAVWLVAWASGRAAQGLARLLLSVQCLLLTAVLIFSVLTKPSTDPHGLMAGIVAMVAVSAMACQYALLRLALPDAVSTAVMTGNLSNSVLSLMDLLSKRHPLMTANRERLTRSMPLLAGFLFGCIIAAAAVCLLADWAWSFPVALAAAAIALPEASEGLIRQSVKGWLRPNSRRSP
jgi:uncharacterized membrane protein YoaK (UPF0700 family)